MNSRVIESSGDGREKLAGSHVPRCLGSYGGDFEACSAILPAGYVINPRIQQPFLKRLDLTILPNRLPTE